MTSDLSDCVGDAENKGVYIRLEDNWIWCAHMQAGRSEGLVNYLLPVRGGGF